MAPERRCVLKHLLCFFCSRNSIDSRYPVFICRYMLTTDTAEVIDWEVGIFHRNDHGPLSQPSRHDEWPNTFLVSQTLNTSMSGRLLIDWELFHPMHHPLIDISIIAA
jgi:hypothetical protein